MDTARLFQSGHSQAERLPKEYRFTGTEVVVKHFGNGVLLLPADDPWQTLQAGLAAFEPGFMLTRLQQYRMGDVGLCSVVAAELACGVAKSGSARNRPMIAAHALRQGALLVTNNIREFAKVPGLPLDNCAAAT